MISPTTPMQREEAPTPTISNRASPKKLPPSLSLDETQSPFVRSLSDKSLEAKFSSPTTSPIVMQRSLHEQTPMRFSPGVAMSKAVKRRLPPAPRDPRHVGDYSSLSMNLGDTVWPRDYESSSVLMSLLFHLLPYVSDILKTNLPWKLLPKALQAIWQHIHMSRHLLVSPSLQPRPFSVTANSSSRRISRALFSVKSGARQGKVQGIANFGQTCFMNSVLQALASLESMLVYLDRIVQIHHDRAAVTPVMNSSSYKVPFAQDLLNLLLMINGIQADRVANHHNQFKVDPRYLLKRIGETHKVFQQSGEQQDAQEYLQALFAVLIADAQLESATAASMYIHFADLMPQEELLTAVVAGVEASHSPLDFQTMIHDDRCQSEPNNPLSLSDLLQRVGDSQKSSSCSIRANAEPVKKLLDDSEVALTGGPEEKKQEDFEVVLPACTSKACHSESLGNASSSVHTSSTSETSWESMSMALKIVEGSICSSTPSPLTGWMGSTIQCCKCQHVHPIRNSPFLDIPLVPTSVTAFLGTMQKNIPSPNHSKLQPCSIEQCLIEFTSVERVQDVECRNCTLQTAIVDLQEEELVLWGALESTERRVNATGGDLSTETKSLRQELRNTRLQLLKLQTMDPDAEDEDIFETSEDELLIGNEKPGHLSSLVRCTARKCLFLTRCPAILCCHIQRRFYDPYKDRMEKCTQKVLFDEYLNLAPYCTYSAEASSSWVTGTGRHSQTGDGRRQKILYQLVSIIEHRGNAFGGHYLCYRRFGSTWFRVSDNNVSPVPWTYVRACEAYMLFYEAL